MSSKLVSSSVKAEGGRPSSTKLQPSVDPKEEEIHMDEEEIQDDEEEAHRVSKKVHAPEQGPPRRRFERDEQSPTSSPSGSRHENSPPHHYDSPSSSRSNSSSYTPPGQGYSRGGGYGMPHYDRSAAMARPDMNPRLAPHHPRPGPPEMNPTWRTPSSPLLRKGKWTAEEEAYVERIILDFSRGFLALPSGTTLRGYLSEKLNCDPMRITKKYAGASSIGKKTFQPCEKTPENIQALERAQMELAELERRFLESESLRAGRRAAASQIVVALNHRHAAEAAYHGHHRGPPSQRHYKSQSYRPGPPAMGPYPGARYEHHGGGGYSVPDRMRYYDQMVEEQWESRMRDRGEVETSDEETDSDHSGGKGRRMRRDGRDGGYGRERERERDPYRGGYGGGHSRRAPPSGMGGGYAEEYRRREEEYNRQGPPPDDYARRPPPEDYHRPHGSRRPARESREAASYEERPPQTKESSHPDHIDGASSSSARSSEASQGKEAAPAPAPAPAPSKQKQQEKEKEEEQQQQPQPPQQEKPQKQKKKQQQQEGMTESDRGDGELLLTFLMSVRKQHGNKDEEGGGSSSASPTRPGEGGRGGQKREDMEEEEEGEVSPPPPKKAKKAQGSTVI